MKKRRCVFHEKKILLRNETRTKKAKYKRRNFIVLIRLFWITFKIYTYRYIIWLFTIWRFKLWKLSRILNSVKHNKNKMRKIVKGKRLQYISKYAFKLLKHTIEKRSSITWREILLGNKMRKKRVKYKMRNSIVLDHFDYYFRFTYV